MLDGVLVFALLLWFCNIPIYLGLFYIPWLTPILCVSVTVSLIAFRILLEGAAWKAVAHSLQVWMLVFAALNLAWFVATGGANASIFGVRLMYLVLLYAFYVLLEVTDETRASLMKWLVRVGPVLVVANIYDVTHPFSFVPASSDLSTMGRAAGTFANPNQCAAALSLLLLTVAASVSAKWRWLYIAWIAIGVALTGSRGAMLGLPVCLGVLLLCRQIRSFDVGRSLLGIAACVVAGLVYLPAFADRLGVDEDVIRTRYLWLINPTENADYSQSERSYLAWRGLAKFHYSELLGNGIGSTEAWAERTSTHNYYVLLLSDFGVTGALILPFLLLMMLQDGKCVRRSGAVVLFFLLWAFVSHNVLTEPYILLAIAVAFSGSVSTGNARRPIMSASYSAVA